MGQTARCANCQSVMFGGGNYWICAGCAQPMPIISETLDPEPVTPLIPRCMDCRVELNPYLDAYWGKDPKATWFCADCRYKKGMK